MSEPPVPDDVRETFASLTAELEDASAIAAQAQSVLTEEEAGKFCNRRNSSLKAMLDELNDLRTVSHEENPLRDLHAEVL